MGRNRSKVKDRVVKDKGDLLFGILVIIIACGAIGFIIHTYKVFEESALVYSITAETCVNISCVDTGHKAFGDNICVPITSLLKLRYTPVKAVILTTSTGDTLTINRITTNRKSMLMEVVFYDTHIDQESTCILQIQFVDGNFIEVEERR